MAIYDPTADNQLGIENPKRQIMAWSIVAVWNNSEEEQILDIPDDVAMTVDGWLTELEEELKVNKQEI
jgi:hypothetical protein